MDSKQQQSNNILVKLKNNFKMMGCIHPKEDKPADPIQSRYILLNRIYKILKL